MKYAEESLTLQLTPTTLERTEAIEGTTQYRNCVIPMPKSRELYAWCSDIRWNAHPGRTSYDETCDFLTL